MKPTPEQVVAEVIAALPDKWEWFYLDRGDSLQDEQVAKLISEGDEGVLALEDYFGYDLWSDYRHTQEQEAIDETFKDAGHEDHRDLISSAQEDEIREALQERDVSDPFGELLRATSDMYFRYLVESVNIDTNYTATGEDFDEQIAAIAEALSIDLDATRTEMRRGRDGSSSPHTLTNREALTDMLINASYGGSLYVFWHGDVEQMVRAGADFGNETHPRTITWTDPNLLVLDMMNGSGFECQISGTVTLPYDRTNVALDWRGRGAGYSWNEVTGGLVGSAYDNKPTIAETEEVDAQGQAE